MGNTGGAYLYGEIRSAAEKVAEREGRAVPAMAHVWETDFEYILAREIAFAFFGN